MLKRFLLLSTLLIGFGAAFFFAPALTLDLSGKGTSLENYILAIIFAAGGIATMIYSWKRIQNK